MNLTLVVGVTHVAQSGDTVALRRRGGVSGRREVVRLDRVRPLMNDGRCFHVT